MRHLPGQVNEVELTSLTREEAVGLLLAAPDPVTLVVQSRGNQPTTGDLFYIRWGSGKGCAFVFGKE